MNRDNKALFYGLFLLIIVFACVFIQYQYDNLVEETVIETLTAYPSQTPFVVEKLVKLPTTTPEAPQTSTPEALRLDLLGISFDYLVDRFEEKGFKFKIDEGDNSRLAVGHYVYSDAVSIWLIEQRYVLVEAKYLFIAARIDSAYEDNIFPRSEVLLEEIFSSKTITDTFIPWYETVQSIKGRHYYCFDGYLIMSEYSSTESGPVRELSIELEEGNNLGEEEDVVACR